MCQLTTPFRAHDMDSLFKKIQKGAYDSISTIYSGDLSQMIASCLNVNPSKRPSTDQLLTSQQLKKRMHYLTDIYSHAVPAFVKQKTQLMKTFYIPSELSSLNQILPKPNYDLEVDAKINLSGDLKRTQLKLSFPNQEKNNYMNSNVNNSCATNNNNINISSCTNCNKCSQAAGCNCSPDHKVPDSRCLPQVDGYSCNHLKAAPEHLSRVQEPCSQLGAVRPQLRCYQNKVLLESKPSKYRSISVEELVSNKIAKDQLQYILNSPNKQHQPHPPQQICDTQNSPKKQRKVSNNCMNSNDSNSMSNNIGCNQMQPQKRVGASNTEACESDSPLLNVINYYKNSKSNGSNSNHHNGSSGNDNNSGENLNCEGGNEKFVHVKVQQGLYKNRSSVRPRPLFSGLPNIYLKGMLSKMANGQCVKDRQEASRPMHNNSQIDLPT